jgi:hypothetical protein
VAVQLQVDAFGGRVGGQQDPHWITVGRCLERGLEVLAAALVHPAMQQRELLAAEAAGGQQAVQPVLGGSVFGEDNQPARRSSSRLAGRCC